MYIVTQCALSLLHILLSPLETNLLPFLPLQTEKDTLFQPFLKSKPFHFVLFFLWAISTFIMSFVCRLVDMIFCITNTV